MTVAATILAQLGGNRFVAMTGAKNFVAGERALTFSIGRGATNKANKVRVTLTERDDYTLEFFRLRGVDCKPVGSSAGVYADQLRAIFKGETGMDCTL